METQSQEKKADAKIRNKKIISVSFIAFAVLFLLWTVINPEYLDQLLSALPGRFAGGLAAVSIIAAPYIFIGIGAAIFPGRVYLKEWIGILGYGCYSLTLGLYAVYIAHNADDDFYSPLGATMILIGILCIGIVSLSYMEEKNITRKLGRLTRKLGLVRGNRDLFKEGTKIHRKKIISMFIIGMMVLVTIAIFMPIRVSRDYTMYRVDGGEWQEYTGLFPLYGAGVHLVEFYSVNKAGNTEEVRSEEIETLKFFSEVGFTVDF